MASKNEIDTYKFIHVDIAVYEQHTKKINNHSAIVPNLQEAYASGDNHSKARFWHYLFLNFNTLQCKMESKDEIDTYKFLEIAA